MSSSRTFVPPALCLWIGISLVGAAGSSGCRRSSDSRPLERVAVIPFENLTPDSDWNWASDVLPRLLASGPASQPPLIAALSSDREIAPARATQVLRGYITQPATAILEARATLFDAGTQRAVTHCTVQSTSPGELATGIAKQCLGVDLRVQAPKEAIEAYGRALSAAGTDNEVVTASLEKAVSAAPHFAPAVLELAQLVRGRGDASRAGAILEKAMSTNPREDSWSAAQFRVAAATLAGDSKQRIATLTEAVELAPYNTDLIRQLSEALIQARYAEQASDWMARLTALEPTEVAFWNQRAYAEVHAGRFDQARASAEQYRKLAPNDPNAEDTSGEIAWMAGRFADAEKHFLEAQRISPQFLGGLEFSKAAFAKYLAGDVPGADAMYSRYLESRRAAQDPLVPVREAHWLDLTGRDQEAAAAYQKVIASGGEIAARAAGLYALLLAQQGDRDRASAVLKQAAANARTPFSLSAIGTVAFLIQPKASPEEWAARAGKAFTPQTPERFKQILVAHALVLDGHAQAAAGVLEKLLAATPSTEGDELRMLFGWSWMTMKDVPRAKRSLQLHPLPPHPGESLLASVYFPAYRDWRKAAGLP